MGVRFDGQAVAVTSSSLGAEEGLQETRLERLNLFNHYIYKITATTLTDEYNFTD